MTASHTTEGLTVIQLENLNTEYSNPFYEMLSAYLTEDFGLRLDDIHLERLYHDLCKELQAGQGVIHLLLSSQTPVGFCVSLVDTTKRPHRLYPGYGFIRDYYIRPSYRRQMLGSSFFSRICSLYQNLGAKGLYLVSSPSALPFWGTLGFQRADAWPGHENEYCVYLNF